MIYYFWFYVICAAISYLGIRYRHLFTDNYTFIGVRGVHWILILTPVLHCITVASVIILVILGGSAKLDDKIREKNWF